MRGMLTEWDQIRKFFVDHGFDKDKLSRNCFDGINVVVADIHEPLEGYMVFQADAPDIFAQFYRLNCSVDRPEDYYRDFFIGECKRTREAKQLVDDIYEIAAMNPPQPVYESVDKEQTISLELLHDMDMMGGGIKTVGEPFRRDDGELVIRVAN